MISYDEALALLKEYNQGEFHLKHAYIVSDVMGWFAEQLGYGEEKEFWSIVGLLHDLDFEQYPDQHCVKSQEIMRARGVDEAIIHATASHGYGITVDIQPEHQMEKVLFATDELTGLIGAAAIMRPSKSVSDLEVKSVKKKVQGQEVCRRLFPGGHPPGGGDAGLGSGSPHRPDHPGHAGQQPCGLRGIPLTG